MLIAPQFSCPECGLPLDRTGAQVDAAPADGAEAWRVNVQLATIECAAGHIYEAIYEERKPWLSKLSDIGARVSA